VRDSIAHLADTDDVALETLTGGADSLAARVERCTSAEDVTYLGVLRGRRMAGRDVLQWWDASAQRLRGALRGLDPSARVPWGIGMRATAFARARLMETWAHGLDVRAALHAPAADADRVAEIALLATRALPYAAAVAGEPRPERLLRVELTLPSGATFEYGPADAPDVIRGPAAEYCRVFVQRLPLAAAPGLIATGDGARRALAIARAFL
jgi:uncharacterized protein (TIGR03084 family)